MCDKVLICDNLALPFREDSFDAVLSIAVVHHFATTERRVHALKELARILRIGGRLVISVWAMEQKHRKVNIFPALINFLINLLISLFSNQYFKCLDYELYYYNIYSQFESQDVLIPWPKSYCMSTADGTKHSSASDGNEKRDDDTAQKYSSFSKK